MHNLGLEFYLDYCYLFIYLLLLIYLFIIYYLSISALLMSVR